MLTIVERFVGLREPKLFWLVLTSMDIQPSRWQRLLHSALQVLNLNKTKYYWESLEFYIAQRFTGPKLKQFTKHYWESLEFYKFYFKTACNLPQAICQWLSQQSTYCSTIRLLFNLQILASHCSDNRDFFSNHCNFFNWIADRITGLNFRKLCPHFFSIWILWSKIVF